MNLETIQKTVDTKYLDKAISYPEYISLLNQLFEQGKTTGENHSENMLNYAKMNLQRMKRLDKTVHLNPELLSVLEKLKKKQTWLLISEGWCGDAAQNIPPISKIANVSSNIELKIVLRDENLELMDQFLSNGSRSIPKLIALDTNNEVMGTWGPRPEIAQNMMSDFKKKPDGIYTEFQKEMQLWYAKDKSESLQLEFIKLIKDWNSKQ